ncbi:MAG: hypothetical protein AAGE52_15440 [Myxococcota bacterium]
MRWMLPIFLVGFLACNGSSSSSETTSGSEDTEDDWDSDDWGDDPAPTVESHHGAIESIGISGPDTPWEDMSFQEREWYMIGKVLPIMKELFAQYDDSRWAPAEYGCATCHGETGAEDNYAMPHGSQYRVPEPGTPAWENMERIFPEVVTFMKDTVTPTVGTLLGIENYTCNHCHPGA